MNNPAEPYNSEEHGMATHEQSDMTKEDWEDVSRKKKGMPKRRMINPAEIDLEALFKPYTGNEQKLIAEVKALRERVAELECACLTAPEVNRLLYKIRKELGLNEYFPLSHLDSKVRDLMKHKEISDE